MIVREVLKNPKLIDEPFDFYNDAEDTIHWLLRQGEGELAMKISFKHGMWVANEQWAIRQRMMGTL